MVGRTLVLTLAALAATARADSTKLDEARVAVDAVRYDDAQRLLVAALDEGGNAPATMRELYRLSASTAVVLGQRDVGEQYYRRWLAIDPAAALGDDVAPKLREPFVAAQAFITAHGRLRVELARTAEGEVEVVVRQPFALAVAVSVLGNARVALPAAGRVILPAAAAGTLALLDEHDNRLVEVAIPPPPELGSELPGPPTAPPPVEAAPSRGYLAWGAASLVFVAGASVLAWRVSVEHREIDAAIADSHARYYTDVVEARDRARRFTQGAIAAGAVGVVLAIPTLVLYYRTPTQHRVIPFVTKDGGGGVTLGGRF